MGVDNNGNLLVGLESKDIPYEILSGYDDGTAIDEWYWEHKDELRIPKNMEIRDINPGYWGESLVGFIIADSGSYDYEEIKYLKDKIDVATNAFRTVFGILPKVFILNYQW